MDAGASEVRLMDHTLMPPDLCLSRSGIKEACDPIKKCHVLDANDRRLYQTVEITRGKSITMMPVLEEALKSDVLIAVPVVKSHRTTNVSLSLKGMMGLVWDRRSMHYQGLSSSIVDVCTVLKADLAVIDGSCVLSTNGPRGPGKVLQEKTIIASADMVAADAYAVSAFIWHGRKMKPQQIGHIMEAHQRGVGRMDIENLAVKQIKV